jgi:hypothetical protein|tara:strand:+ start:12706 stop:13056 length:351 start_codon:yes stop_codon:yes gene_type:complete
MIRAEITNNGVITLAIYGEDVEKIKTLPSTLSLSNSGVSKNFKTGRQCQIIRLDEVEDMSTKADGLNKKLATEKRATIKAKSDYSKASNEIKALEKKIKALEKKLDTAFDAGFEED